MNKPIEDTELRELCKKVYERTGWDDTLTVFDADHFTWQPVFKNSLFSDETPLYTSDYLLEKLPKQLEHPAVKEEIHTLGVSWHIDEKVWVADYERSMLPNARSDTPLKALLKLAIALSDAKELS